MRNKIKLKEAFRVKDGPITIKVDYIQEALSWTGSEIILSPQGTKTRSPVRTREQGSPLEGSKHCRFLISIQLTKEIAEFSFNETEFGWRFSLKSALKEEESYQEIKDLYCEDDRKVFDKFRFSEHYAYLNDLIYASPWGKIHWIMFLCEQTCTQIRDKIDGKKHNLNRAHEYQLTKRKALLERLQQHVKNRIRNLHPEIADLRAAFEKEANRFIGAQGPDKENISPKKQLSGFFEVIPVSNQPPQSQSQLQFAQPKKKRRLTMKINISTFELPKGQEHKDQKSESPVSVQMGPGIGW
jgi:hypothetical protein